MSMSFSLFYGISFQSSGSKELTKEIINIGNIEDENNPVFEEIYIVDDCADNSDIAFGIFVDGYSLEELPKKYNEYIKDNSLIDIIQNIIEYAVSQNIEVPNSKKYLERIKKNFPKPIIMEVYI